MLVNIIVSVIVIVTLMVLFIRFLAISGINFPTTKLWGDFNKGIFNKKVSADRKSYDASRNECIKVAFLALLFRIVVYIISALIMRVYMSNDDSLNFATFIGEWKKWDANNYIRIATLGYKGYQENGMYTTLVFFPLYAWIMRGFNLLFNNIELAALVVSTLCYCIGCGFLYKVLTSEYGLDVAKKTIMYLSLFPFSFFLGSMMPEAAFFMILAMEMYFIKEHKWVATGIVGILAALTRMQGILVIVLALVEWFSYRKPFQNRKGIVKNIFTEILPIFCTGIGSLIYLLINYKVTGDPFKFLEYQKAIWNQEAQWFGKTVSQLYDKTFSADNIGFTRVTIWAPEFFIFIIFLALIVYGVGKVHDKYMIFMLAYLIMNYLPAWLLSAGRYMTVAIPAFIVMAVFSEKYKKAHEWIIVCNTLLFCMYLYGFLTWKQIM
ncbi:MAG: glycosyltransferase family 39 protein [Lachnospiraceae bacterium]|nr:glycosyltransferase family 39 protein [Lachnospiraceae bacterium]